MDRETVDEIKRYFGIVVEDVRSDVRGVAEGVDALRDEMHREIGAVREEIGAVREDLGSQIRAVDASQRALREEMHREIGAAHEDLGGQILAVDANQRALREDFGEFRGGMAEEFEETRALVRLSYGQIDRRVQTLETEMADVRTRLERVEGRTSG